MVVLATGMQPSSSEYKIPGIEYDDYGFVVPKDEGVFHGSKKVESVTCAHPVQVYLDLFDHPERAMEAAGNLRIEFLNWNKHA